MTNIKKLSKKKKITFKNNSINLTKYMTSDGDIKYKSKKSIQ